LRPQAGATPEKTRGEYAGVVEDDKIGWTQKFGKVAKLAVITLAIVTLAIVE
jgi:hypothetical protein